MIDREKLKNFSLEKYKFEFEKQKTINSRNFKQIFPSIFNETQGYKEKLNLRMKATKEKYLKINKLSETKNCLILKSKENNDDIRTDNISRLKIFSQNLTTDLTQGKSNF